MKCIEIIKVQTATVDLSKSCWKFLLEQKESTNIPGLVEIQHYQHTTIPVHIVILLVWQSRPDQPSGSSLGAEIVHELKQFGLVDNSVWVAPQK